MPLYHYNPILLAPGSAVLPGNWGRIIRNERLAPGFKADGQLRELAFELVRVREFGHCISRLDAAFAFETLDHCLAARPPHDLVYEVELVDPTAKAERRPWEAVKFPDNGMALFSALEHYARIYWQAASIQTPEVLTLSGLRIVKQVG